MEKMFNTKSMFLDNKLKSRILKKIYKFKWILSNKTMMILSVDK
jgi:hypothetical protein